MKHTVTIYYQVQHDDDPRGCPIEQFETVPFLTEREAKEYVKEIRFEVESGDAIVCGSFERRVDDRIVDKCHLR